MANTTMSAVDKFPITAKIRKSATILADKFKAYAEGLSTKTMVKHIQLISDTWEDFKDTTKGSKVQFACRLDPTCPTERDKNSDGSPGGYSKNSMYNAIRNATTRAVASKGTKGAGPTSDGGLVPELLILQMEDIPSYTLDQVRNHLEQVRLGSETGDRPSKKVIDTIMSLVTKAANEDAIPEATQEEIDAEVAEMEATG